jgi:hypothetical protein
VGQQKSQFAQPVHAPVKYVYSCFGPKKVRNRPLNTLASSAPFPWLVLRISIAIALAVGLPHVFSQLVGPGEVLLAHCAIMACAQVDSVPMSLNLVATVEEPGVGAAWEAALDVLGRLTGAG